MPGSEDLMVHLEHQQCFDPIGWHPRPARMKLLSYEDLHRTLLPSHVNGSQITSPSYNMHNVD
jgi:hypothetical protein